MIRFGQRRSSEPSPVHGLSSSAGGVSVVVVSVGEVPPEPPAAAMASAGPASRAARRLMTSGMRRIGLVPRTRFRPVRSGGFSESAGWARRASCLVAGLPLVVGHPVDQLASVGIGDLGAPLLGGLAVPARQAVAAEAREVH